MYSVTNWDSFAGMEDILGKSLTLSRLFSDYSTDFSNSLSRATQSLVMQKGKGNMLVWLGTFTQEDEAQESQT